MAGRVQPAAVLRPGVDPDRRRALGRRRAHRHRRLGARLPRREAGDPAVGDPGALRRHVAVGRRHGRARRARHDLAGLQQWGGYSLYHGPAGDSRSHVVSFDRPYSWSMGPANDFRTSTIPLVAARRACSACRCRTSPTSTCTCARTRCAGARGYVSMGHDEYWTTTMRGVVTRARAAGTNLAILGANTMYWRVRLEDDGGRPARRGWSATATRRALDPMRPRAGRDDGPLPRRPGPAAGARPAGDAVRVLPRRHGLRRGDAGLVGLPGHRVSGRRRDPRAGRARGRPGLPRPHAAAAAADPQRSRRTTAAGAATVGALGLLHARRRGAAVFNAGTLRWVCALADRCERPLGRRTSDFAGQVTDNLLRVFAAGPVGCGRPARDNVDAFHLSAVNTVSAS